LADWRLLAQFLVLRLQPQLSVTGTAATYTDAPTSQCLIVLRVRIIFGIANGAEPLGVDVVSMVALSPATMVTRHSTATRPKTTMTVWIILGGIGGILQALSP